MENELNKSYTGDEPVMLSSIRSSEFAEEIRELLENAGIYCFLRDATINRMVGGLLDLGGIRIYVKAEDVETALQVLDDAHIVLPDENDTTVGSISRFVENLPIFRNMPLEKKLWTINIIILAFLVVMALVATLIAKFFN